MGCHILYCAILVLWQHDNEQYSTAQRACSLQTYHFRMPNGLSLAQLLAPGLPYDRRAHSPLHGARVHACVTRGTHLVRRDSGTNRRRSPVLIRTSLSTVFKTSAELDSSREPPGASGGTLMHASDTVRLRRFARIVCRMHSLSWRSRRASACQQH